MRMNSSHDTPALKQADLETLVAEVLRETRTLGANQAEAGVSIDSGLTLTVRLGEVETLEYQRDHGLGITVYFGRRKGSASTADLSPAAVKETVRAAVSIARYTAEDECAGLADVELMAQEFPDLDLNHPWALSPEDAIEIARNCEDAARAFDKRIENSEGATISSHQGLRVYGNSHGFVGGYASSAHSLTCAVIGRQDGNMCTRRQRNGNAGKRGCESRAAHRGAVGRAQTHYPRGAGIVHPGSGARIYRSFSRRHARRRPVPAGIFPVGCGG